MKHGRYEHYKGKFYEVFGEARHSETLEEMVVYKSLYFCERYGDQHVWVRPKTLFCGMLEVNGEMVQRFKYVGD